MNSWTPCWHLRTACWCGESLHTHTGIGSVSPSHPHPQGPSQKAIPWGRSSTCGSKGQSRPSPQAYMPTSHPHSYGRCLRRPEDGLIVRNVSGSASLFVPCQLGAANLSVSLYVHLWSLVWAHVFISLLLPSLTLLGSPALIKSHAGILGTS